MAENRGKSVLIFALYSVVAIALAALGARFVLPVAAPFVLAFLTAALIEPVVSRFETRVGVRRWIMSGLMTLLLLGAIVWLCCKTVTRAYSDADTVIKYLTNSLSGVSGTLERMRGGLYGYIETAPAEVREYLERALDGIIERSARLPGEVSAWALRTVTRFLSHAPDILLFIAAYTVGTFFISSRYHEVRAFIRRQIPENSRERWDEIRTGIAGTLLRWLKAQLMLACVTFFELTAGFVLLRVQYPVLIALFTAVVDALPVLGVGTVLLPWAAYCLITGETGMGIGLAVMYGVIAVIRSLLEPKLVGAELGLHPVATLIAIYVGFKTVGAAGMILFPIALIVIKHLNDERIITLWR